MREAFKMYIETFYPHIVQTFETADQIPKLCSPDLVFYEPGRGRIDKLDYKRIVLFTARSDYDIIMKQGNYCGLLKKPFDMKELDAYLRT